MTTYTEINFKNITEQQYNRLLSTFKQGKQEYAKVYFYGEIKKYNYVFKKVLPIQEIDGSYILSTKSKGARNFLIIHRSGMWLVNPPNYNLIIRSDGGYLFNAWHTTIFDGDVIEPIHRSQY